MDPVKRQPYDNTTRQARSEDTRQRIVDAARALILEHGYRATRVAEIAQDAGVHVDTVYALVGRKPMLLRELVEQAISGRDVAVAPEERDYVKQIRAEPHPARKLAIYAGAVRRIQARMAPLFLAVRDASMTEQDAKDVWREISDRRAANMRTLVRDLRAAGGLRDGVTIDEAADVLWATNSSELFTLLTGDRGWSLARYERWLAESWCRLLLPDGVHGAAP